MSASGVRVVALAVCALCFVLARPCPAEESAARGAPNAEKLGWRLGCQAYSFNKFTFYEAVDKNASLGLKYIEAYPGQQLSKEKPDLKLDHNMSPETRDEVKAKLREVGVTLVNYGVVGLSNDEAANRIVFDFAKAMGIETIVSEPPPEALELIDKLCQEYDINMAIHNHPRPSRYWNPKKVLDVCQGRSKRIGACADTGHWMRSGVDPLDALKMLEGRIVSFHFKELNEKDRRAHDVPWGTGAGDVKAWLTEIKRQGVKAVFSIEYEHNWLNSVPEIAECVKYFDKVAEELSAE
jgi:sugar phosphate isomerase/epimerase